MWKKESEPDRIRTIIDDKNIFNKRSGNTLGILSNGLKLQIVFLISHSCFQWDEVCFSYLTVYRRQMSLWPFKGKRRSQLDIEFSV